jgi:CheY-like chemotaxis protein
LQLSVSIRNSCVQGSSSYRPMRQVGPTTAGRMSGIASRRDWVCDLNSKATVRHVSLPVDGRLVECRSLKGFLSTNDPCQMSTILIAFERKLEQSAVERLLSEQGHAVVCAGNGVDALDAARREPPSLAISDILLPKMDGFALCKKWKQDPKLQGVPFMFYTGKHDPKYERFARELSADRFVERGNNGNGNGELLRAVGDLLAPGFAARQLDTEILPALTTGAFSATARFAATQPVPANTNAGNTSGQHPDPAEQTDVAHERFLAREARLLTRVGELSAQNRLLQDSERNFRLLFDRLPTATWVQAGNGECLAVNAATLALYGCSREQFMEHLSGKSPLDTGVAVPDSAATWHRSPSGATIAVELLSNEVQWGEQSVRLYSARNATDIIAAQQSATRVMQAGERRERAFAAALQLHAAAMSDEAALLNRALAAAAEITDSPLCYIGAVDTARLAPMLMAKFETAHGDPTAVAGDNRELSAQGASVECLRRGQALIDNEGRWRESSSMLPEQQALLTLPIAHEETLGVLVVANRSTPYSDSDIELLRPLAQALAVVWGGKRAQAKTLAATLRADLALRAVLDSLNKQSE